jgi:hypothetical protein
VEAVTDLTYAAELDYNNVVVRVIVGTAAWAVDNLGGTWVDPPELVGIGWVFDGEQIVPPPVPEPDPDAPSPDELTELGLEL